MDTKIRLHMPAIPHTITKSEYCHCAFTGKVLRFIPMMMSIGYEVYHYGVETSETTATKNIELMSKKEWDAFRIVSYKFLYPNMTDCEINDELNDIKKPIYNLANIGIPLYKVFNARLKAALRENYRDTTTDIVCLPFQKAHDEAVNDLNVICIESGIGYNDSYRNYRVFESYAHLHYTLGVQNLNNCSNYFFVAPNYYNTLEFPLNLLPTPKKIGFFGRICDSKGMSIIIEVAKQFPDVEFVICGKGDYLGYLTEKNIVYKEPVHGDDRGIFLGSLTAMLSPSLYVEPFAGSAVEAQLCGCPIITQSYGAYTETVENFKTGILCHTLQDYCDGVQRALDGKFDRQYIGNRARQLYDMYKIAHRYNYIFNCVMDIHNGANGWYSENQHSEKLEKYNLLLE
jgi:glycosyltransferase involved in cell wall biosynthesis